MLLWTNKGIDYRRKLMLLEEVVRRWAREECGSQAKTNVLANAIVTCGVVIVSVDGWELRADAKRGSRPSGRLTHVLLK
jgi:hypothetical protein